MSFGRIIGESRHFI